MWRKSPNIITVGKTLIYDDKTSSSTKVDEYTSDARVRVIQDCMSSEIIQCSSRMNSIRVIRPYLVTAKVLKQERWTHCGSKI
jgi:hypothetical protein